MTNPGLRSVLIIEANTATIVEVRKMLIASEFNSECSHMLWHRNIAHRGSRNLGPIHEGYHIANEMLRMTFDFFKKNQV